jgi:ubiquinone/menaquinone biosynthesis C-methylase UbiE
MSAPQNGSPADEWFNWLLHERHGDDSGYAHVVRDAVARFVDRVLDGAGLFADMTLVDIGTGDGVVGLRAIERLGKNVRVIFTDISAPLLQYTERLATERNVLKQCTFLQCSAENLAAIADSSVDAVAARASVAYVADKAAAFREFHRLLKPGGRMSIAEPIMQDEAFAARALKKAVEGRTNPSADGFLPLLHRWKAAQFPDTEEGCARNPLVNFSERDLLNMVRGAGFSEIHLQLAIDVTTPLNRSWDVFVNSSPHPWAPSLQRILADQFSQEERRLFESVLRPTVESGKHPTVDRIAYVIATK